MCLCVMFVYTRYHCVLIRRSLWTQQHVLQGSQRLKKTYQIESLPQYVIFHVKRFTRNNFFTEKNPTIVNFPVKNLELREYLHLDVSIPTEEELAAMYEAHTAASFVAHELTIVHTLFVASTRSISDLRALLSKHNVSSKVCVCASLCLCPHALSRISW